MSSYSDYARGAGNLIMGQGAAQADATRQSGAIWANTLGNLGNIALAVPEQRRQEQELRQRQQVVDANQKRIDAAEASRVAIANAISGSLGPNGKINKDELAKRLGNTPDAGAIPELFKMIDDGDERDLRLRSLRNQLEEEERGQFARIGDETALLKDPQNQAGYMIMKFAQLVKEGRVPQSHVQQWTQGMLDEDGRPNPEKVAATIQGIRSKAQPQKAEPYTLAPGQTRFGPNNQVVASVPERLPATPAAPAPAPFTLGPGQKRFGPNGEPIASVPPNPPAQSGGGASAAGGAVPLEPDAIEDLAIAYRMKGQAAIPTRFDENDKKRIINAATKQRQALGQTGAEVIQKQATLKADAAALTKMTGAKASAEAFENKALAQIDIISDLSTKVDRTKFPIINAALQSGRTNITGDENATKLANAIETFSEEYAKIIAGSTGSAQAATDSTRNAAKRLINAAMSKGTMSGVLGLMQQEMGLTVRGYDYVISDITERLGGPPAGGAAPAQTVQPTGRFNPATGKVESLAR